MRVDVLVIAGKKDMVWVLAYYLIAEFYLVDRGLRHRLPGFSSLNRRLSLRRVSAGSGTNGHTAVVALRGRTPGELGRFDRN